jgi:MtaA/CmuA family methyltransferase
VNGRERVLAMLEGRPVDHLPLMPITMMFAADRIGVRYREYSQRHEVLVEAQIRTAEELGFDYVSCISDPVRETADCGGAIIFPDDEPPATDETNPLLADKAALTRLRVPDPLGGGRMWDRVQAAAAFKERVGRDRLVEGWVEGPCAEAADLRGLQNLMLDCLDDPAFVRDLFAFSVEMAVRFAKAQIDAGVDLVGVGDAASSLVGPDLYEELVWPFQKRLVDALHALGTRVRLHICGNTRPLLAAMGRLGCAMVDLDSPSPMAEGRAAMGPNQVLCGNLDPVRALRNVTPEVVAAGAAACHREAGARFIVGAGCEVPRGTPRKNVMALADYARSHLP